MQLSKKHIADFQKLYESAFGERISEKEAHQRGLKIVKMMEGFVKPKKTNNNT